MPTTSSARRRRAPKTIDEYIDRCAPQTQPILRRVRATVAKAAPDATETISYGIPAFKLRRILVYFAAFKHHIGLYPPVKGDAALEQAVAPYAGEKGNLRFPIERTIPYALIARIVRFKATQSRSVRVPPAAPNERLGRTRDRCMPKIRFRATLTAIGSQPILRLPEAASRKLPSRGMSMVEGTFNGHAFQAPLEPDGIGSHWFKVSRTMLEAASARVGDSVSVALEPVARWPDPEVPGDLARALASDPQARRIWLDITPLARWDWIRWIGATRNRDTRTIRIDKTLSKLRSGKRAACCFNRSRCTDTSMSRNGVLRESTPASEGSAGHGQSRTA